MSLKLEAEVGLNAAGFHRGIEGISHTLKSYALGAIGVYSIEAAFHKTIETVKELVHESERMGVTIEQLQVMRKAASGAGVEIDVLAGAMEKLNIARAKALGGGADGAKAMGSFAALGVTPAMLASSSAQDIIFGAIHKKIESVNPQQIAAPLRDVLGKGFGPLIPLIAKDFDKLKAKMESLGMIISSETAHELKNFDSAINSIKNMLITRLAPALVQMLESIMDGTGKYLAWIDAKFSGKDSPALDINQGDFWKKLGHGGLGMIQYGLGIVDTVAGNLGYRGMEEEGQDRLIQGQESFKKSFGWMAGGALDSMADELLKNSQGGGLKAKWDEWRAELKKKIDELAKPPLDPDFSGGAGGTAAAKGNKHHTAGHLQSDSLVSTGNFLGSLQGSIPEYETQKVHLLQRIADNTAGLRTFMTSKDPSGDHSDWA